MAHIQPHRLTTRLRSIAPFIGPFIALGMSSALAGDLDPPPGPVAPTMHRLDEALPSTPITAIPTTITQPGAYHLASNLIGSSGLDGITIDCPTPGTVDIDFRGFTLSGPSDAGTAVVITGSTISDVTLKRGTVRGWITGERRYPPLTRMKIRPLQDRVLHMRIADTAGEGIQILSDSVLVLEHTTITGAGGHAVDSDARRTELHHCSIISVGGDGVHVPAPQTREHILLARQVGIHDTDGDGIDAADAVASLRDLTIDAALGAALVVGTDLDLRDSRISGSVATGANADIQGNEFTVDVDNAGTITFGDGKHGARLNTFTIRGTTIANLPAINFLGDDVSIIENVFHVVDQPVGPATLRNPPHFITLNGSRFDFHSNAILGIQPGTEGIVASGNYHSFIGNSFAGTGQNCTGLIDSGSYACFLSNTFRGMGPEGFTMRILGAGVAVGPIVTPATLSTNSNPDRNLHIPD